MKNLKKHKASGEAVSGALYFSIMFLILFLVMMCFFDYVIGINNINDIRNIVKTYKIHMETQGVLSSSEESALKRALEEKGMTNVCIKGNVASDLGKAEWGEEVSLVVTGNLAVNDITASGNSFVLDEHVADIKITEKGVAFR